MPRSERECWTAFADDARRRAEAADSEAGRQAMEVNAAEFERLANESEA
ncbi:hypothetical protein [Streptomyces sp. WAC 01325]|nr:hypothetical protein [Streptomyces sp. WAC 01325]